MTIAILIIHIFVAITLMGLILLQSSKGGLGSGFGQSEGFRSKRGAEKVVFSATIITTVIFFITSIANLLVH